MHFRVLLLVLTLIVQPDVPMPKHIEPTLYPPGARLAHLQGTVSAHIKIDQNGAVASVTTEGRRVFSEAVKISLERWTFYVTEPNKADLIFIFRLAGTPLEQNAQTMVTYDLPNTVTITTQPPVCDHCPENHKNAK